MTPQKFNVAIAVFTYGGSSSAEWMRPEIANWMIDAAMFCRDDPRIGSFIGPLAIAETPLSYGRNVAFEKAREAGADFLLLMDNDIKPDSRVGIDPRARKFLPAAFNFASERWHQGPHVVTGPYVCIDGDATCVHAYRMTGKLGVAGDDPLELDMVRVSRHEAAISTGFEPVLSSIIGWSLWDVRAFDLLGPRGFQEEYSEETGRRVGTEDLPATRNLCVAAQAAGLPHPLYVNWDGWAGHYKVVLLDKPQELPVDAAVRAMRQALAGAAEKDVYRVHVDRRNGMLCETPNGHGVVQ